MIFCCIFSLICTFIIAFNLSFICAFTWLTLPGPYRATTCQERELTLGHVHTFLTTQGHGGPPRIRDQLNSGATSETTRTWKMIHTIHASIHSNKANMKGWLWRPNDIRGPCVPKTSWHLSYRRGKSPRNTSPRKRVQTGDRTRPRWQARMLPPARQRGLLWLLTLYFLTWCHII